MFIKFRLDFNHQRQLSDKNHDFKKVVTRILMAIWSVGWLGKIPLTYAFETVVKLQ